MEVGSDKPCDSIYKDSEKKRRENATLRNASSEITPIRENLFKADTLRATPKIRYYRRGTGDEFDVPDDRVLNTCLSPLQDVDNSIDGNPLIEFVLPAPPPSPHQKYGNREYNAETEFSSEQKQIYDTVLESVVQNQGKMFFLGCSCWNRKNMTYLQRSEGKAILLLLSRRRVSLPHCFRVARQDSTCHVQIPINLESAKSPVCGVSRNSDKGHVLKDCSLFVWDERTMTNRKSVEAEDRTLQDIRRNEHLMGGVPVCLVAISSKRFPFATLKQSSL
ncbi:hypothetical protein PYW08_003104 [Mythimna loreyi]|uniref:Uncharacterized protein n=1 Tax=Mythimna loreyi TaxID=667449 RepID=A0ACC2QR93_9NEOP|nr:hypothetical protein PYW08_003104 [Mythimna loreyi]